MGYVELTIPPVGLKAEPQGNEPVPVLLHAYTEWSDRPDSSPITLATGQAYNEIVPIEHLRMPLLPGKEDDFDSTAGDDMDTAGFIENPASIAAVIANLGQLGKTPENVEAMNHWLREAGHDLHLTGGRV